MFKALRYIVRVGGAWHMLLHDFPPWPLVYPQTQHWFAAGVFEARVHDLRVLQRQAQGRQAQPSAAILDNRTPQSTPESGSKVHVAVDTLGQLLALKVKPADEQGRAQVGELPQQP